jgi:hypothetical protein
MYLKNSLDSAPGVVSRVINQSADVRGTTMWNWFNCFLSGRHDFGMWCEPGSIFLRCIHCGKRSSGWSVDAKPHQMAPPPVVMKAPARTVSTVIPFGRAAAR